MRKYFIALFLVFSQFSPAEIWWGGTILSTYMDENERLLIELDTGAEWELNRPNVQFLIKTLHKQYPDSEFDETVLNGSVVHFEDMGIGQPGVHFNHDMEFMGTETYPIGIEGNQYIYTVEIPVGRYVIQYKSNSGEPYPSILARFHKKKVL